MASRTIKIAPSILAADFARLGDQVVEAEKAGADRIHVDVMDGHFVPNLHRTIQHIKALGKKAGVVVNPATPASVLEEILPDVDVVLVMTVNPGFGGQHFLRSTLAKIGRIRQMIERAKPQIELEVDGGIDAVTAPEAVRAGAEVLVAGTSIFRDPRGVAVALDHLRASAQA